jgi:hypothetical protein
VVDREFWVSDGGQAKFEQVFGPDGIWQNFLGRSAGYAGSEVRRESVIERRFRLRDFWNSHFEFENFREKFAAEYEELHRRISTEGQVEKERLAGMYYTDEDERGSEQGLVPA